MHQDDVPFVPQGFYLLASTDISINQGMVSAIGTEYHFTPTPASRITTAPSKSLPRPAPRAMSPTEIHIITVQGHPEFTRPIVSKIVSKRAKQGIVTDKLKEDVDKRNEALPEDKLSGDGDLIGRAFWTILGVWRG